MQRWLSWSVAGLLMVAWAPSALAEEKQVPKDPQNQKGISPYWEALKKGDAAYSARDFPAAIAAYKEAVQLEPQNPLGHYRMGQAHLANSEMREAENAYVAALRFSEKQPALRAKVLFVIADLRERQADLSGATERWDAYAKHVQASPEAKGYPASAEARKAAVQRWQETQTQYAAVKERILQREREADKSLQKSAK